MRAMWRGAISFGLVTIGVRLYAATEEHDYRFHQVHRSDGGRIRYKRVCEECGKEIDYADIVKGYELTDGRVVLLDKDDFDSLPVNSDRAIDVLEFVSADDIDPIHFQKSYYLAPEKTAIRPYVLLRETLEKENRLAVVKITLRQRETLAMVRAREDVLVLHTMLWPDEIRKPNFEFLDQDTEVRPQELKMASSLVRNMSASFKPDEFSDEYQERLGELIEAKAKGAETPKPRREREETGEVVDLMSALEESVQRSGGGKTGTARRSSTSARASKSSGDSSKTGKTGTGSRKSRSGKRSA
ncbi:MAG: Ku protein [Pseudonocardiaceae bacterium]|nr:Ku protein [Pseudonocardiaceae bacterium]